MTSGIDPFWTPRVEEEQTKTIYPAPAGLARYSGGRKSGATRRGPIEAQPESERQSGDRRGGKASQATADRSAFPGPSEHAKRRVAPRVMQSKAGGTASSGVMGGVVVLCSLRSRFTKDHRGVRKSHGERHSPMRSDYRKTSHHDGQFTFSGVRVASTTVRCSSIDSRRSRRSSAASTIHG